MDSGVLHYHWRRPRFIASAWLRRLSLFAVPAYLVAAGVTLRIDPERIMKGIPRAAQIFSGAIPPDFAARGPIILDGFVESIQMTLIATLLGVLASIPFGFLAAKNISPRPLYLLGRTLVIVARGLHPVVLGVLFVAAIGFGALAGILTLIVYTIGFVAKLLAEAIEEIDWGQVEALRSTGAGAALVLTYAVFPQIVPRLVGLSIYQLDINLRASAIVGVVGAGGIGQTLNTAFGRYDYGTASAILLVMIGIILVAEMLSGRLRGLWK